MPNIQCKHCKKTFYCKHSIQQFCDRSCYEKSLKYIKDTKNGFYCKHKDTYQDKIIDYPNAPTARAYIGIAKTPLMPNKNGIGYQGVILQDENRTLLQCSGCGEWMKKIASTHLEKCSQITTSEYKEKFGLLATTGLVSDETSLRLTKSALKNKEGARKFLRNQKRLSQAGHKAHVHTRYGNSLEWKNKHGTCPEQLKTRLYEFIRINREFPSSHNKGAALAKALYKNFGSIGQGMKHYGLPSFHRFGSTYIFEFPSGEVYKFNLNIFEQREQLYGIVMDKCISLMT